MTTIMQSSEKTRPESRSENEFKNLEKWAIIAAIIMIALLGIGLYFGWFGGLEALAVNDTTGPTMYAGAGK